MASILDPHATGVMLRLNSGETFQSVCDWLVEFNISITRQSVHGWYSRKMRKIRARNPDFAGMQETASRSAGRVKPRKIKQLARELPLQKSLEQFISEGEQELGSLAVTGSGFVAKPRHAGSYSPFSGANRFSGLLKESK